MLIEVFLRAADWVFWVLTVLVHGFVVYLFVIQRLFRTFLFLSLYFLLATAAGIGRCALWVRSDSLSYRSFYYQTECLLAFVLFAGVWQLSVHLGAKKRNLRFLLWSGVVLLILSGFHSLVFFRYLEWFFSLPGDIYYACGVFVGLLWLWTVRHVPQDQAAARLLNVVSIYFVLFFIVDAAEIFGPHRARFSVYELWSEAAAWLPLGSGFALLFRDRASLRAD